MSSSSTITYTSVYSNSEPWRFQWVSDDELEAPKEVPPSPDYMPGPKHPPSPDYMPGLEHPSSPNYVPELEYPEYLVPSDAEVPIEDQPLPVDALPTTYHRAMLLTLIQSPQSEEDDDEEEVEHLAPADSFDVPAIDPVPSAEDTEIPSPPLPVPSLLLPLPSPPTHTSPSYADAPLGYRRARFTAPASGFEVGETLATATARQPGLDITTVDATPRRPMSREDGYGIKDVYIAEVERARHARTGMIDDADRLTRHIQHDHDWFVELVCTARDPEPARDPKPQDRPADACRVATALAEYEATRGSGNGDDSQDSRTGGRRQVPTSHECTYSDFLKCQPLNLKGTKGFGNALTWWNSYVKTVSHEVAYEMTWKGLKKMMTDKYCPRGEIKKLEIQLWNLKVKSTDVLSYNQRFQDLALMCSRMFPEESDEVEKSPAAAANNQRVPRTTYEFVSTTFIRSLIDIIPTTLDYGYDVELADELGSFDIIIGMDWLTKYHAVIVCDEKIVRIPFGNEILIVYGDGSNNGHESRLNIISCTKTQKYLLKGCHVFLAHITTMKAEDKLAEKRLEDVPIV
ncbi:putative reverse transcriptase domain-containing protein [Tanacetum coccineum]